MFEIVSILTLFNVSLFLEVLIYLMRQKYVKQDSNNIFFKNLILINKQIFWKKSWRKVYKVYKVFKVLN